MDRTSASSAVDTCPRCGGTFHCGAHDREPCACAGIKLDDATLTRLRATFRGCLCLNCLRELAREAAAGARQSAA